MVKFLPSYVGSKAQWVGKLGEYSGRDFVELFCGSAVLSANLAKRAVLNDLDPFVFKILNNFEELIVPDEVSPEDYFEYRSKEDWWKYAFCLQKMSFSGVFRYSKNGYNVPIKDKEKKVFIRKDFEEALNTYKKLSPIVLNRDYQECNDFINKDSVLVLDPPYEKAQASYNSAFDYHEYWEYIRLNENICSDIIVFDFESNLPFGATDVRKTRVNGARTGNVEGMFVFKDSLKEGHKGEELFEELVGNGIKRLDGLVADFEWGGKTLELKSDYYDMERTPNFFIERYSDIERKTDGGPWRSLREGTDWFCYFYPKNRVAYLFNTKTLVKQLEPIIKGLPLIEITNKTWVTGGYKIPRELLKEVCLKRKIFNN